LKFSLLSAAETFEEKHGRKRHFAIWQRVMFETQ